jgi:hypothetical protein
MIIYNSNSIILEAWQEWTTIWDDGTKEFTFINFCIDHYPSLGTFSYRIGFLGFIFHAEYDYGITKDIK